MAQTAAGGSNKRVLGTPPLSHEKVLKAAPCQSIWSHLFNKYITYLWIFRQLSPPALTLDYHEIVSTSYNLSYGPFLHFPTSVKVPIFVLPAEES